MNDKYEESEAELKKQRQFVSPMLTIRSFNRKFLTPTNLPQDLNKSTEKRNKTSVLEDQFGIKHQKLQTKMQNRGILPKLEVNCRTTETKESDEELTTPRRNRPILKRAILRDRQTPEGATNHKLEDCLQSVLLETISAKDRANQRLQSSLDQSKKHFRVQHKSNLEDNRKYPDLVTKTIVGDHHNDSNASSDLNLLIDATQSTSLYTIEGAFFLEDDDNKQKTKKPRHKHKYSPPMMKGTKTVDDIAKKKLNNSVTLDPVQKRKQANEDIIRISTEGPKIKNRKLKQNFRYLENKIRKERQNFVLENIDASTTKQMQNNNLILERSMILNKKPNHYDVSKAIMLSVKGKNSKQDIDEDNKKMWKKVSIEFDRILTTTSPLRQKNFRDTELENESLATNMPFLPERSVYRDQSPLVSTKKETKEKNQLLDAKQKMSMPPNENIINQNQLDWLQDWVKVYRPANDKIFGAKSAAEKSILSLPARSRQLIGSSPQRETLPKKFFMSRQFFAPSPSRKKQNLDK